MRAKDEHPLKHRDIILLDTFLKWNAIILICSLFFLFRSEIKVYLNILIAYCKKSIK